MRALYKQISKGYTPEGTGNRKKDIDNAWKEFGPKFPPHKNRKDYTWNHTDDNKLILVPRDLHDAIKHTGGVALSKIAKLVGYAIMMKSMELI